jgi:hypothetical protein
MESFLDSSLFPFLVIIVVAGVNIVLRIGRLRRGRQQQESAPEPVAQAMPDDGDDEASFSAWDLSVNDEPAPPRRVLEALPRVPVSQPGIPVVPPDIPEAPVQTAAPDPMAPPPVSPEQRFSGLSPLQKGVVWAEILGAPKGL